MDFSGIKRLLKTLTNEAIEFDELISLAAMRKKAARLGIRRSETAAASMRVALLSG